MDKNKTLYDMFGPRLNIGCDNVTLDVSYFWEGVEVYRISKLSIDAVGEDIFESSIPLILNSIYSYLKYKNGQDN
jgi:hypothetical protein